MDYKCPLCTGELRLDNHTRDYFTNCEWPKVCDTGPTVYHPYLRQEAITLLLSETD